jgi:hypothetical protein
MDHRRNANDWTENLSLLRADPGQIRRVIPAKKLYTEGGILPSLCPLLS